MKIFDRYIFKSLLIATIIVTFILTGVILLTQSLRFLELVMNAGASSLTFWILTILALPRFFEIILPIALAASVLFIYNKMTIDSEIIAMRATGTPPLILARPALYLAGLTTIFLLLMTTWFAPVSLNQMQKMQQIVKAQYSSLLFREGVFNAIGTGLTVYVRERASDGSLQGLMIHDSRVENKNPVTVIARRGIIVATDEGQQVVVYDGSRQDVNQQTGTLNRLDFTRYTIDLPDGTGPIRQRWREPDERTFWELLNPDPENQRDAESEHDFFVEIHKRLISPFLAMTYTSIALVFLLLGPLSRRGQGLRITAAIGIVIIVQGLYLALFNLSRQHDYGLILMYALTFAPLGINLFILSKYGEAVRQRFIHHKDREASI